MSNNNFKQYQVIRVSQRYRDLLRSEGHKDHPLAKKNRLESVLYLGEIHNMQGHCAVALRDGRVIWGLHIENFEEVPEDD